MIGTEETTALQLAVEQQDQKALETLTVSHSAAELSEVQIFGNQTLFMYTCELGTPEMVRSLLDKGVTSFELEWSDNNEIKSALRNTEWATEILMLVMDALPSELCVEMIESDWDPEPHPKSEAQSPLYMAGQLDSQACLNLLTQRLSATRS